MKVRHLLNKDNWIKYAVAKNQDNQRVDPKSPEACKWCLLGAVIKCYLEERYKITKKIQENKKIFIDEWNDRPETKWKDVKDLIEELDI